MSESDEKKSGKSKLSKHSKKSSNQADNVDNASQNKSQMEQNSKLIEVASKNSKILTEKQSQNNKPKENKQSNETQNNIDNTPILSTRLYLEQNLVPVVQEALLECARKRPEKPLEFVGNYILNKAHENK